MWRVEWVWVVRRKRKARRAQRRLSCQEGEVRESGWRRVVPDEMMRDRPAPTWIPLITGTGIFWLGS